VSSHRNVTHQTERGHENGKQTMGEHCGTLGHLEVLARRAATLALALSVVDKSQAIQLQ
jgi:hypothetical protein